MSMESCITALHHVGTVVSNIDTASKEYTDLLGYRSEGEIVHERSQRVYVRFLRLGDHRIELIQPASEDSPVSAFLTKGGVLTHLCYETSDIEQSLAFLRKKYRAVVTCGITPSDSLENSVFAFVARPSGDVIELVQFAGGAA